MNINQNNTVAITCLGAVFFKWKIVFTECRKTRRKIGAVLVVFIYYLII